MKERVQKIISNAGICSRRHAETLIEEGKVKVNGELITIGDKADKESDQIEVEGKLVQFQKRRYLAFNKPRGYLTTLEDPKQRKTIFRLINIKQRVIPIGRLDLNTAGLLLLTNDGDFANAVMHPRYEVEKTYEVELEEELSSDDITRLKKGISIQSQRTWPAKVHKTGVKTYKITIHEGRNRIIRKMMRKVKKKVVALRRLG